MSFNWKNEYFRYHRYYVDMQKKGGGKKVRSFAWLSLTIFTISFFAVLAIRPTLVTIASLNQEIKDKRTASLKLQEKINAIVAAQRQYADNTDNLYLLSQAFPEKSEYPTLALFFEQTAMISGVELKSLSFSKIGSIPSKNTPVSPTADMDFSIGVSGDFLMLKNFLKDLESSRRLLTVKRTTFTQIKNELGEITQVSLLISGSAFFQGVF